MTDENYKKENAFLKQKLEEAQKKLELFSHLDEVDYGSMSLDEVKQELDRRHAKRVWLEETLKKCVVTLKGARRL